MTKSTTKKKLNTAEVARFLQGEPEFFKRHSELLESLNIPHESGAASSLLLHQVTRLRDKCQNLEQAMAHMVDVARENEMLLKQVQQLIVRLMDAPDLDSLFTQLHDHLGETLGADVVTLMLFDVDLDPAPPPWVTSCAGTDGRLAPLESFRKRGESVCGRLPKAKRALLFPDHADQVRSCALIPLSSDAEWGVLAVGSFRADRFAPDLGTLFLEFLGQALARNLAPRLAERRRRTKSVS